MILELAGIRFSIRHKCDGHLLEFEVYDWVGKDQSGVTLFELAGCGGGQFTEDVEQAARFAHGSIRWDGCCNVMFDECADNCMLHGCCREDMSRIGKLFDELYGLAAAAMPEWVELGHLQGRVS
jgi:hypothetical protein